MNVRGIPLEARTRFSNTWLLLYFSASTAYCCVMLMKLGLMAEHPDTIRAQSTNAIRLNDFIWWCGEFAEENLARVQSEWLSAE